VPQVKDASNKEDESEPTTTRSGRTVRKPVYYHGVQMLQARGDFKKADEMEKLYAEGPRAEKIGEVKAGRRAGTSLHHDAIEPEARPQKMGKESGRRCHEGDAPATRQKPFPKRKGSGRYHC
jgi:hypothetical protein